MFGYERQVLGRNRFRERKPRRVGVELVELQPDALAQAARPDAGGIELLNERDENCLDLFGRRDDVGR